jgi:hypothetical protein
METELAAGAAWRPSQLTRYRGSQASATTRRPTRLEHDDINVQKPPDFHLGGGTGFSRYLSGPLFHDERHVATQKQQLEKKFERLPADLSGKPINVLGVYQGYPQDSPNYYN